MKSSKLWEFQFSNLQLPPGFERPTPDSFVTEWYKDLENEVEWCDDQLKKQYAEVVIKVRLGWIEFHEKNGWPDDPGYKERMYKDLEKRRI